MKSFNHTERRRALVALAEMVPDFATKRAIVRPVASKVVTGVPRSQISAVYRASPIIGSASHQVNPPATHAGLRDALDVPTLEALACGLITMRDVLDALVDPAVHGVSGSGTKTGYAVGRPAVLDMSKLSAEIALGKDDLREIANASVDSLAFSDRLRSIFGSVATRTATTDNKHIIAAAHDHFAALKGTAPTATTTETPAMKLTAVPSLVSITAAFDALTIAMPDADDADIFARLAEVIEADLPGGGGAKQVEVTKSVVMVRGGRLLGGVDARRPLNEDEQKIVDGVRLDEGVMLSRDEALDSDALIMAGRAAMMIDGAVTSGSDKAEPADDDTLPAPISFKVDPANAPLIDSVLASVKLPSVKEIEKHFADLRAVAEKLSQDLKVASSRPTFAPVTVAGATTETPGAIPEGKTVMKKAYEVFGLTAKGAKAALDFDIPVFEWAFPHPHVPALDPDYVFRPDSLIVVLGALLNPKLKPWVHGHTGTGKSTLIMQVAARTQYPTIRVNFDSEITRMDLIGRDTLTTDPKTGATITRWEDGILPQALRGPYILLLDEIDFVRPDVSYVMQRVLEDEGLMLTENGGEMVRPHPMNRIFATANTRGQGDEHGMYQGARPQSMAFLDRFLPFIEMPYMSQDEERALLVKRHPALPARVADTIVRYTKEHRQAFTNAEILQPISPRGVNGLASQFIFFLGVYKDEKKALRRAFDTVVKDKASVQDAAVVSGLIDRVMK